MQSNLILDLAISFSLVARNLLGTNCCAYFIFVTIQDFDTLGAIVATVESSSISACSAGSMVSMGKFQKLCLRFAEDFNHTLDDWKPDPTDPSIMNLCLVSEVIFVT